MQTPYILVAQVGLTESNSCTWQTTATTEKTEMKQINEKEKEKEMEKEKQPNHV